MDPKCIWFIKIQSIIKALNDVYLPFVFSNVHTYMPAYKITKIPYSYLPVYQQDLEARSMK